MVGIVIVSHSSKMVDHLIEFLDNFKTGDFDIINGSDSNLKFGSTYEYVKDSIIKANKGDGVLVFVDLGSSIDNAIKAKKDLQGIIDVEIADCALIEGAITAVAANDSDTTLTELKIISQDSSKFKKIKN